MIQHYIEAMRRALAGVLGLVAEVSMPLAIFAGFLMVSGVAALFLFRNGREGNGWPQAINWRRPVSETLGSFGVALFYAWFGADVGNSAGSVG